MFCCNIGHNIAVKVRQHHYFNPFIKFRIKHLRAHGIHKTLLDLNFRILFSYLSDRFNKVAVRQLYDIRLCNYSNVFPFNACCISDYNTTSIIVRF